ncbi:ParB N-terminal domain-containing protein [Streptomyces sp. NPDC059740]|uniref:ParB/RepB/Spo0J family partition protein n=1 Tax=Streptomyces sp. NPDC059740 TaxID=3346926 RepID=UPI0036484329
MRDPGTDVPVLTSAGAEQTRSTIVAVAALAPADSPRRTGLDQDHVTRLAETAGQLPPILIRRFDMRVVDGMHRLAAAMIRGQTTIEAEFFDGSAEEAFLRAVEANVVHGLPLSLPDRRAAASRIMMSHPQLSDRAIARSSGLGDKAVAALRRRLGASLPEVKARMGRDGRIRPVCAAEGRRRAAEVIASNPHASLREVARLAGVSPGTVSDVRRRLERGQPPVSEPPSASPEREDDPAEERAFPAAGLSLAPGSGIEWPDHGCAAQRRPDAMVMLKKLLRDPSLRLSEEGRSLLRVLQQNAATERSDFAALVPSHCGELVSRLARHYAETWLKLAQELEERVALEDLVQSRRQGAGIA